MPNPLVVTIAGTPDKCLSPNAVRREKHWGNRYRATKAARHAAWASVLEARGLGGWMNWQPPITLHAVIAWEKGRRSYDPDSAHAILKATIDGIADAIGVDDRFITLATVTQTRDDAGAGFVRVAIEQAVKEAAA